VSWPVSIEVPVAWGDMDAFAHVNNTIYLRWFESARIAYFHRTGVLDRRATHGVGPILARATIDFRKPVTFPDQITVSARVPELRNTSFTMAYRITSHAQGGVVVAEGDSVVVMLNYETGEKVTLSDELRKAVAGVEAGG
jgi:acyl-CoA thioester hydrolase